MTDALLMKGNEVIAEAAVMAGCRFYAGYPITPQNEIPEYMSWRMPEVGGVFIQAESELAAVNMVYGASAAGVRAMTSSSSPGISLKQEGISYLAGAELPAVIVNIQRGGPGLGNISGSQQDYFQATRGGGHGDYRLLVYAPFSHQELWTLTMKAFDRADEYRNPVMLLADGVLGQMMEPFVPTEYVPPALPAKDWVLDGCRGRPPRVIKSLYLGDGKLEMQNMKLQGKYQRMKQEDVMYEAYMVDDAEVVLVAFGIAARVCLSAVKSLRKGGRRVGLFRPVTLFPFPEEQINDLARMGKRFLVAELNLGQMVDDVRLAADGLSEVRFYGRSGGSMITVEELTEEVVRFQKVFSSRLQR
ncbi:MAG: 3-methyl-2-oxobutanoate dehydrogenase subunit VorB [Nitrospirae bacterium]|nr:3-methyl-2-oxobutanoate dehydrogenase subunit VorB [Nitrospirota bacterium]